MEIIPAIDIINGKCVRLTKGDFNQQKIYNENPLEVAKIFEDAGIKRLHLVDLDGAKFGQIQNLKTLEVIASSTNLIIDFGGGVKKEEDIIGVFNVGAAYVTIGSIAVLQPKLFQQWLAKWGTAKFIVGVDVLNEDVKINGWQTSANKNIFHFIDELKIVNVNQIFCTDIEKDGMQAGASFELYKKIIKEHFTIKLIASGGVTTIDDIDKLNEIGCSAVIIGKAIYEGSIMLSDLKKYL